MRVGRNSGTLSLLGWALGLGLTFLLFQGLDRWPSDWILFLDPSKRPGAVGAGPLGLETISLLKLPFLSPQGARSMMLALFGSAWFLVLLLLPMKGWKPWEGFLWGAFAGGSHLFVPWGPAILGNLSHLLPLVFLLTLSWFRLGNLGEGLRGFSLAIPLLGGAAAGFLSLLLLGPHLPWGEGLLVWAIFGSRDRGKGALLAGAFFFLARFGGEEVLSFHQVLNPSASLVDLLGPEPLWMSSLWQVFPAALALRVAFGERSRSRPLALGGLYTGLGLLLVLAFGQVSRWKKISPILLHEEKALASALSEVPDLGQVMVWNLPSFLRANFAVQTMGSRARFIKVDTWDLGGAVHIPENWNFPEKTPVLRWTRKGFVSTQFEECLLLPPFPLAWKGRFAKTPYAMLRMGMDSGNRRVGKEVEVDWEEAGVRIRVSGRGGGDPFAVAVLGGRSEVFVPSKHVLGSLSEGWFTPPFPSFRILGKEGKLLPGVLPGVGPWVQRNAGKGRGEKGEDPPAVFRLRVLR